MKLRHDRGRGAVRVEGGQGFPQQDDRLLAPAERAEGEREPGGDPSGVDDPPGRGVRGDGGFEVAEGPLVQTGQSAIRPAFSMRSACSASSELSSAAFR